MFHKFELNFYRAINPIREYIMTGIIFIISVILTYFGFSFFGLKKCIPPDYLWIAYIVSAVAIFFVLIVMVAFIQTIHQGEDIDFPLGKSKIRRYYADYRGKEDTYEIPIILPIKNRDKHTEIVACATFEQFEIIFDKDGILVDNISREYKENRLIRIEEPRLHWHSGLESSGCEMEIFPQDVRYIEVARFMFLLKQSYEQNNASGAIRLCYCGDKNQNSVRKTQLGLYKIRIAIKYKKDNELRTKLFKGYIYANIVEHPLDRDGDMGDIRERLECEVAIASGDPIKNEDIPKPRKR